MTLFYFLLFLIKRNVMDTLLLVYFFFLSIVFCLRCFFIHRCWSFFFSDDYILLVAVVLGKYHRLMKMFSIRFNKSFKHLHVNKDVRWCDDYITLLFFLFFNFFNLTMRWSWKFCSIPHSFEVYFFSVANYKNKNTNFYCTLKNFICCLFDQECRDRIWHGSEQVVP